MISRGHFLQPVRCFIVNMFDVTFNLETLIALQSERERCDRYIAAERDKAWKGEEPVEYSSSPVNEMKALARISPAVVQDRIMVPLSPAMKGRTENSVPSETDRWVDKDSRETKPAKKVVTGFEV